MKKNGFMVFNKMVTELGLSGNELVCFAYLYNEVQDKEKFTGGYEKIAAAIGTTIPTAYNVLKKLREKGLVQYDSVTEISVCC